MIIEFFGPPGAGKTTLAYALANRLQESGHSVDPMLSCRPSEHRSLPNLRLSSSLGLRIGAVPRRLSRSLLELLAIACQPLTMSHDIGTIASLLRILPPANMAVAIRLSQYALRLSHCWRRASSTRHIVVFDQAFVQLICSFVLLGHSTEEALIARALDFCPRSDLLVRIDAPPQMLAARLQERDRRQSVAERLFELDLDTNLKSIGIIDQLNRLLLDRRQAVIRTISADQRSLSESVDAIEAAVVAKLNGCAEGDRAGKAAREQGGHMNKECRYA